MQNHIIYRTIEPNDFDAVIALGTQVHGEGYIDQNKIKRWVEQGIKSEINASYVAYDQEKLIGFRITFSAEQWQADKWCSPQLWRAPLNKVCYFKCNTVDENYRGYGVGSQLLNLSISAVRKQGAVAGISHLWMQSPGNSAVKYFTKCGGELVKVQPDRWNEWCLDGYICPICASDCHCSAAEMIIYFD